MLRHSYRHKVSKLPMWWLILFHWRKNIEKPFWREQYICEKCDRSSHLIWWRLALCFIIYHKCHWVRTYLLFLVSEITTELKGKTINTISFPKSISITKFIDLQPTMHNCYLYITFMQMNYICSGIAYGRVLNLELYTHRRHMLTLLRLFTDISTLRIFPYETHL